MKTFVLILLISIACLQISCEKSTDNLDNRPAITNISFAGVPQQNVKFDARNSTITIQLPAILPEGLKPVLEMTEGARVVDGLLPDNTIDLTAYCYCNTGTDKALRLAVGNGSATTNYEIRIVTSGTLKAQEGNQQLTFSRKTKVLEMSLPVENLYTNPSFNTLIFTEVTTGNVARINADGACLNGCKNNAPNQLIFKILSPIEHSLQPGTYTIEMSGLKFPQRLVVTD